MVFPAKTDRARILSAAMDQLARDGMEKLSLRSLAASLNLAPNALYRYFASRSQLEAAIAAEIAQEYGVKDINGTSPPSLRAQRGAPIWSPV